mmetsp:Transcript_11184/g.32244  ORF Transcript_11184/g.32244 Transcript_11184/m.32244 type:complete len:262 (-) Transcript_11184:407-1192(-)
MSRDNGQAESADRDEEVGARAARHEAARGRPTLQQQNGVFERRRPLKRIVQQFQMGPHSAVLQHATVVQRGRRRRRRCGGARGNHGTNQIPVRGHLRHRKEIGGIDRQQAHHECAATLRFADPQGGALPENVTEHRCHIHLDSRHEHSCRSCFTKGGELPVHLPHIGRPLVQVTKVQVVLRLKGSGGHLDSQVHCGFVPGARSQQHAADNIYASGGGELKGKGLLLMKAQLGELLGKILGYLARGQALDDGLEIAQEGFDV